MKKIIKNILLSGILLFTAFLPVCSSIVHPHAGLLVFLSYFLFFCPIYFIVSGVLLARYAKKIWYFPIMLGALFLVCTGLFTGSMEMIFGYLSIYIPLGYLALGIGYFFQKKQIKAEEQNNISIQDLK